MWFGVLLLTHYSLLQARERCADSVTGTLAVPHISDEYNSIGLICASKSWKTTVVSKLPNDHIVFIKSNILPLALLSCSSHEEFVDSVVVKVYPRYL